MSKANRGHKGHKANKGHKGRKANKDLQAKAKADKDLQGLQDRKGHKVSKGRQDPKGRKVSKVSKGQ